MPKVSICIPSYKPDFMDAALRSALSQTFTDVEIIVSDDCPTDAIQTICEKYRSFLTYVRNPSPGPEKNLIHLLSIARGEYVKFLFDDDILHPFCIQYLLELLETTRQHGTVLALSPRYIINEHNQTTELIDHFRALGGTKFIGGRDFIRVTAFSHANLVGEFTTVLFRRADCYRPDGSFRLFTMQGDTSTDLPDLSAFIELAELGNLAIHQFPLSYFRRHDNATSNPANNPRFVDAVTYYEKVLNYALERQYLSAEERQQSYRNLLNHYGYWVGTYPQLSERMNRIKQHLAA